jgi:hypothetical protein
MTWFRHQHPEAMSIAMPADYPALAGKLRKELE